MTHDPQPAKSIAYRLNRLQNRLHGAPAKPVVPNVVHRILFTVGGERHLPLRTIGVEEMSPHISAKGMIGGLKNLVREGVANLDPAPALFLRFVVAITHDANSIVVFAV